MDLPRADSGKVERVMALRREQPVEQVEQIAGNPAIEEKSVRGSRYARQRRHPSRKSTKNLHLDPLLKNWTNMNSRMLCFVAGANTVFPAGPEKIHIAPLQHMKVAHQRSCRTGCFSRGVQLPLLVVYDLLLVL